VVKPDAKKTGTGLRWEGGCFGRGRKRGGKAGWGLRGSPRKEALIWSKRPLLRMTKEWPGKVHAGHKGNRVDRATKWGGKKRKGGGRGLNDRTTKKNPRPTRFGKLVSGIGVTLQDKGGWEKRLERERKEMSGKR